MSVANYNDIIKPENVNRNNIIDVVVNGPSNSMFLKCCFSGETNNILSSSFTGCYELGGFFAGTINFREEFSKFLPDINLYWQIRNGIMPNNNLNNKTFKINHNGEILNCDTIGCSPIFITSEDDLAIKVKLFSDDEYITFKTVTIKDLIKMNEDFFKFFTLNIKINSGHRFFEQDLSDHIKFMTKHLSKIKGLKFDITVE